MVCKDVYVMLNLPYPKENTGPKNTMERQCK